MDLKMVTLSVFTILAVLCVSIHSKKITEVTADNCEVCHSFMTRFIDSLDENTKKNTDKINTALRKMCKTTKKDDNRFCYYVGGLEESATGLTGDIAKPLSWGVPADKICMKLYRSDAQICDLKYDKTIDFAAVDLKKLKVKDLKNILAEWDENCRGCTEKSDYVDLIEELMVKYAPEAAEKRKAMKNEL